MTSARHLLLYIVIIALAGCAAGWTRVDSAGRHYKGEHFSAELPEGWMLLESDGALLLSRDGPDLQRIVIEYRPHDKAFRKLEKTSSPDMLPSELAELAIAEFRAGQEDGLPSMTIVSNRPATLAGRSGYALHIAFKTDAGLRTEVLLRGAADQDGFYQVMYRAPTLHYFERDRAAFEELAGSLQP